MSKRIKIPAATPSTEKVDDSIEFADLVRAEHAAFDALKAARLHAWKEALIERPLSKAYHIASDRQLCMMVRRVPKNLDDLKLLPGFGLTRCEEHGNWLLATLQPYVNELHAAHAELQTLSAEGRLAAKQDAATMRLKSQEEAKVAAKQVRAAARQAQQLARDKQASVESSKKRSEFARLSGREYLNVHFLEKDLVKSLGAKWDAQAKLWWVPIGWDVAPFRRWMAESNK